MDISYSDIPLIDNDELDIMRSDTEGSSGYGSGSDDGGSLCDFPISSTEELTDGRSTRNCDVMKFTSTDTLCDSLKYIMRMPDLCDVIFRVGKDAVPVYGLRAILGTRSRVFYQLILKHMKDQEVSRQSSKIPHTSAATLVIPVVKYDVAVFRSLIEYVHCGTTTIQINTVVGLLCAADQFELEDLKRACWNCIEFCLQSGSSERLMHVARQFSYHQAGQRIISRIYRHYNAEEIKRLQQRRRKETTV